MRRPPAPLLLVLATGCLTGDPESTLLTGTVFDAPDSASLPLGGATVETVGIDGAVFASTTASGDGAFEVDAPFNQLFAVVLSADGYVKTSITGFGTTETTLVRDRDLFARSEAWVDDERARFAGCPGADGDAAIVEGILRAELPVAADQVDTLPVVTTGSVDLALSQTSFQFACYLDDTGVYDEEAELTGETGRFAFFEPPEDTWATVTSTYTADGMLWDGVDHPLWIPAGGIASLDPAFVEQPIQ